MQNICFRAEQYLISLSLAYYPNPRFLDVSFFIVRMFPCKYFVVESGILQRLKPELYSHFIYIYSKSCGILPAVDAK